MTYPQSGWGLEFQYPRLLTPHHRLNLEHDRFSAP